jgi:phosphopantothenoylcysteine decarboxylase/phosphopantothenate--cysteine ligase
VENPTSWRRLAKAAAARLVVGFAAETHEVRPRPGQARAQGLRLDRRQRRQRRGVMGGDDNTVAIVTRAGDRALGAARQGEVARRLAARIAEEF